MKMFTKGQKVTITFGQGLSEETGVITRKVGNTGYKVKYWVKTTTQDFVTSKLSEHDVIRERYFKTENLEPYVSMARVSILDERY